MSVFGGEIRRLFSNQAAEVAKETLKVEALQVSRRASLQASEQPTALRSSGWRSEEPAWFQDLRRTALEELAVRDATELGQKVVHPSALVVLVLGPRPLVPDNCGTCSVLMPSVLVQTLPLRDLCRSRPRSWRRPWCRRS